MGALIISGIQAAFQGGNYFDNVANNFHTNFRVSVVALVIGAAWLKSNGAEVIEAGSTGISGYVKGDIPGGGAFTVGAGTAYGESGWNASRDGIGIVSSHELGRLAQYAAFAPTMHGIGAYLGIGAIDGLFGVAGIFTPWYKSASYIGLPAYSNSGY